MNNGFTVRSERNDGTCIRQAFRRPDGFAVLQSVDTFVDGFDACLPVVVRFLDC